MDIEIRYPKSGVKLQRGCCGGRAQSGSRHPDISRCSSDRR